MATINTDYTQTKIVKPVPPVDGNPAPTDYQNFNIFVRPLFYDKVIMEPEYAMDITSANSIFRGNEIAHPEVMLDNLDLGTEVNVIIEKDQNPFNLFAKDKLTYTALDGQCANQLQLDCSMACLNTLPDFEIMKFRFDTKYTWGVVACDKNRKFWDFNYYSRQYNKSQNAKNFGQEVDLWNTFVTGIIAAPAATVMAKLAQAFPTHYWANLGSVAANARTYIPMAVKYMFNALSNVNLRVVMPQEMGYEIIKSVENPYNLNNINQRVNTDAAWDIPGYLVDEQVRDLLGLPSNVPVLFLRNSPWFTYSTDGGATIVSQYPLWNADGSKQYCAIFDPRVVYQFKTQGYHLDIVPYDCNHIQRGMQEEELVGSGITFPIYGMILEFDGFDYKVPEQASVNAAMEAVDQALNS